MQPKFKVGDTVRNLLKDGSLEVGDIGTIADEDNIPYVFWHRTGLVLAQFESKLELVEGE